MAAGAVWARRPLAMLAQPVRCRAARARSRMTLMTALVWWRRTWLKSSPKTTSLDQWTADSMIQ